MPFENMTVNRENHIDKNTKRMLAHWHTSIEFIMIESGSMNIVINSENYLLEEGDICVINSKQIHVIYTDSECSYRTQMNDPVLFTADKVIYEKYIAPIISDEAHSHIISKKGEVFAKKISNIMNIIARLEYEKPPAYELGTIGLIHTLFYKLYEYYITNHKKSKISIIADALIYRQMADMIYKNYPKKITLDEIAAVGNVSRSKCCKIFKDYATESPLNFLNLYRLKQSAEMLKNTADDITSIAYSCGFGQQSYFNRLFLREYGITPKEYRNQ